MEDIEIKTVVANLDDAVKQIADCIVEATAIYRGVSGEKAFQSQLKDMGCDNKPCTPVPADLLDQAAEIVKQASTLFAWLTSIRGDLGTEAPKATER